LGEKGSRLKTRPGS